MGVEHLPEIAPQLIAHGRSPDTPVALIQEGTTQNQLIVTGTLADIVAKSRDVHPPAVLVVGEVVRLHDKLDWFTPQTLSIQNIPAEMLSL
jgi:siroheme synthase